MIIKVHYQIPIAQIERALATEGLALIKTPDGYELCPIPDWLRELKWGDLGDEEPSKE